MKERPTVPRTYPSMKTAQSRNLDLEPPPARPGISELLQEQLFQTENVCVDKENQEDLLVCFYTSLDADVGKSDFLPKQCYTMASMRSEDKKRGNGAVTVLGSKIAFIFTTVWVATPTKVTPTHFQLDDMNGDQLSAGDKLCFTFVARCTCTQAPDITIYIEGNIAGDHVKFGLPMASSTTLLTWSLVQFKKGYENAGQLDAMYDSIRWPLDYFLSAWDEGASSLLVQVGDGNADHAYWGRAEEMTMSRPCQYVSTSNKGSDVAAETAAAMAVGALAFQDKGEQAYSAQLLQSAESLYSFAKNNRGVFGGAAPFYSSSGDEDELCVAAMFLYKATGSADYLADAQTFVNPGTPWSLSWDNKFIACQILLFEATGQYKSNVQSFFRSWSQDGGMTYTPCGLAWRDNWGSTRYAGNAAFAALVAADVGIDSQANRKWAVEQINYILGDNRVNGKCLSFVVGYGSDYPQQPHHRGASCPDLPAPCGWSDESASTPNPQVLYGALVGGPDSSGNYNDDRGDYISNEVATDYNSGFQGALAGIAQLENGVDFPETSNMCACGI
ncbi:endoglucanase [Elysia marginata]|uniref:Endoglucanase n=1 Tax=Elysia marginata TaxID=1093978 RepID=A0AAV4JEY4_9GAST|nr:endoglucanase [Elysia marginata]